MPGGGAVEGLRVTSWKRFGHDRLYVDLPDGTSVGWADRRSGDVVCLRPSYRDAVLDAIARHTPTAAPPSVPRSSPRRELPPLTPENDLARRRPGATLHDRLTRRAPGPLAHARLRLSRRPSPRALAAERRVGAELHRLGRYGWRVLHSVPLPREPDIAHLLIGPGGVFTVTTKHHPGQAVHVTPTTATIGQGPPRPYPLTSLTESTRARTTLEHFCAFPVSVHPVLVFVAASAVDVAPAQRAVRVYQDRQVSGLGSLTGVLTPAQVEEVYRVARDRRAWLGV